MGDLFDDKSIRDRTLDRKEIQALTGPQKLVGCDLEDADLSRLDLSGWSFEQCNLRRTNLRKAQL
jgi:fluoroquinolone resistance protein